MEALQIKPLRSQVKDTLRSEKALGKWFLISMAVVVGYNILTLILEIIVSKAMVGTGGLAGMQTRAILETVLYLVPLLGAVLLPIWQIGVVRIAISANRRRQIAPKELLKGFARLGPILLSSLILGFALMAVIMTCVNIASVIFSFSPLGNDATMFIASYMGEEMDYAALMEKIPMDQLLAKLAPAYILAAVIGIPAVYFVWCKFRMTNYVLLDDEKTGVIKSILKSVAMSARQFWAFLVLDLGFWWYYLLMALVTAAGFADLILPALGVKADPEVLRYAGLAVNYLLSLLVAWLLQPRVELTYAAAYDALNRQLEAEVTRMKETFPDPEEE